MSVSGSKMQSGVAIAVLMVDDRALTDQSLDFQEVTTDFGHLQHFYRKNFIFKIFLY